MGLTRCARVSTVTQDRDRQIDALAQTGVAAERIYVGKQFGSTVDRSSSTVCRVSRNASRAPRSATAVSASPTQPLSRRSFGSLLATFASSTVYLPRSSACTPDPGELTPEVVEAARRVLLTGHSTPRETCHLSLRVTTSAASPVPGILRWHPSWSGCLLAGDQVRLSGLRGSWTPLQEGGADKRERAAVAVWSWVRASSCGGVVSGAGCADGLSGAS